MIDPDGKVVQHTIAEVALAYPIAWWDGNQYVVAGLPCPGWRGQPVPEDDEAFVGPELCHTHTKTYRAYSLEPATGKVQVLGDIDGGYNGLLVLGPVIGKTALVSTPPEYHPVRVDTSGTELAITDVDLAGSDATGLCASGDRFVAIDPPSMATGPDLSVRTLRTDGTTADPATDPRRRRRGRVRRTTGMAARRLPGGPGPLPAPLGTRRRLRPGVAHRPTAPIRRVDFPSLAPLSFLGTISDTLVATTGFTSPTAHFRIDQIVGDHIEPIADLPGMLEDPMYLALTKTALAYFPQAAEDPVHLHIIDR